MSDWREHAACVGADPDLFFPGQGESTFPARDICLGCPVRTQCLTEALSVGDQFGVWGGLNVTERRNLRRRQRRSKSPLSLRGVKR